MTLMTFEKHHSDGRRMAVE